MTQMATNPFTLNAIKVPPGPAIARTWPLVVANPMPIIPPIVIAWKGFQQRGLQEYTGVPFNCFEASPIFPAGTYSKRAHYNIWE